VLEKHLLANIIEVAQMAGWLAFHPVEAQVRPGVWATNQQGDRGFPDLVLSHPERHETLFIECKSETGQLSMYQVAWRNSLKNSGCEWWLIKPHDFTDLVARLTHPLNKGMAFVDELLGGKT